MLEREEVTRGSDWEGTNLNWLSLSDVYNRSIHVTAQMSRFNIYTWSITIYEFLSQKAD